MRYVDTEVDRARWRTVLTHRLNSRVQLGVEWNASEREFNPVGSWVASVETDKTPLVLFGLSSDRIGSPEGTMAYFTTIAKTIPGTDVAPYVGLSYSEWKRGLLVPFGLNARLTNEWSAMYLNDGRRSHAMATWSAAEWSVSALWIWLERPGLSISWSPKIPSKAAGNR